ncbi:MAG: hypothetical protein AB7U05_09110 [Mangrovibacterium sp.]
MMHTEPYFKAFAALPAEELSPEDKELLFFGLFCPDEVFQQAFDEVKTQSWALRAMQNHLKAMDMKLNIRSQFIIHYLADGTIGHCVTYIRYLQYWMKVNGVNQVSIFDLTTRIFPHGFPAIAEINRLNETFKKEELI